MSMYWLIGVVVFVIACAWSYIHGVSTGKHLVKGTALTVADIKLDIIYRIVTATCWAVYGKEPDYAVMAVFGIKGDEGEPLLYRFDSRNSPARMPMPSTGHVVRFSRDEVGNLCWVEVEDL